MTLRFTQSLSLNDYIAANWLYQRKYWLRYGLLKVYGLGAGLFFLMMLALTALSEPLTWAITVVQLGSALLFGLFMVVAIPLISAVKMLVSARRHFREMSLDLPATYEIDSQGFRAANHDATVNLGWDRMYDFVQDKRVLLLRRARRIFFILPKSQLTSPDLDTVLVILRGAGVKEG